MAGEDSAGKAELGTGNETPADGTSAGGSGGAGVNINAHFQVRKLTADQPAVAAFTDPQLKEVWGVTSLAKEQGATKDTGTFLNVAQDTGLLIEVKPTGEPTGTRIKLDRAITGITVNESDRILMEVKAKCGRASVLVASQSGRVWAANPEVSTTTGFVVLDRAKAKSQFTDITLIPELGKQPNGDDGGGDDGHGGGQSGCSCGSIDGGNNLRQTVLLADFHNGRVVAFDDLLQHEISLGSKFQIPSLPKDFAPFGLKMLDDMVVVTAAQRRPSNPKAGEEPGIDQQVFGDGKGIVAAFDLTGKLMWRTQSNMFNVPWGLEMGALKLCATGALLVAQHGDATRADGPNNKFGGTIIAINAQTGKVVGPLLDGDTQPVRVQGIWGLTFGENIANFDQSLLHMGAGPIDAKVDGKGQGQLVFHGLFARLDERTKQDP